MIPEHPSDYNSPEFLEWVNAVIGHRHGNIRKLDAIVVYEKQEPTSYFEKKVKRMNKIFYNPRRPDEPVIVLRGLKTDYLLDGNRRINTWIRDGNTDEHSMWLVCPVY